MKSFVLFLCSVAALLAASDERPKEYYDPDVQKLIAVEYLAFGPVGYAGTTSDGEAAFATILKKKESIRYMLAAFDAGTPEARCYALIALRELSDPLYDQCDTKMRTNPPAAIRTMKGCVGDVVPIATMLADIERGVYRKYFTQHEAAR
jgi:hypothetical protein